MWIENIHAGVMRVEAGVVMDVDTRKWIALVHDVRYGPHHIRFGAVVMMGSRPDAVIVRLMLQAALARGRSFDVADEDRNRTWQGFVLVVPEQLLNGIEPGGFIAMKQCADEQGFGALALKVDQCRRTQQLEQIGRISLQETVRQDVGFIQHAR